MRGMGILGRVKGDRGRRKESKGNKEGGRVQLRASQFGRNLNRTGGKEGS